MAGELRTSVVERAGYGDPAGHAGLRGAAIARYVGVARSVRAGADYVLVTHGAQQALDLICRVLVAPGERVAVGCWPGPASGASPRRAWRRTAPARNPRQEWCSATAPSVPTTSPTPLQLLADSFRAV